MFNSSGAYKRAGMAMAIILLIILVVVPLLFILLTSIFPKGVMDFSSLLMVFSDAGLREVFWKTMLMGACVVAGTTLVSFPLAWILAKTDLRKHGWLDAVLLVPFMTPPYICSMGWILFMQRNGYLEQLIPASAGLSASFFSLFGMVVIMSLQMFPFLYLIFKNALLQIGGSKEDAAMVHGAGFLYMFRKVIIPLLLSSYASGALLIFVKTISEFGTPITFGRRIGYFVMATEIHKYISSWPIDFGKATSLSSVLLSACLVMWYASSVIGRRFNFNLVGGKASKLKTYTLKKWQRLLAWFYILALLFVSIAIPYISIITASLMKLRSGGLQWGNFTLAHYAKLLSWGSASMEALLNSLSLAVVSSTLAVILGTAFALAIKKSGTWPQRVTDLFSLLPNTVPGIVMVVGLILVWNSPWMPVPIYNTYWMVVLTYVVFFLPYTVQYVKTNYGQIDESLFHAGSVFGGREPYILRRIVVPLLASGMLAGWMMTFTISFRELVASLMILPPSMRTTATYIYSEFEQGNLSLGMAMAVISVVFNLLMLLCISRIGSIRKFDA